MICITVAPLTRSAFFPITRLTRASRANGKSDAARAPVPRPRLGPFAIELQQREIIVRPFSPVNLQIVKRKDGCKIPGGQCSG